MIKQGPVKHFACLRGLGPDPNTVCVPKVTLVIFRLSVDKTKLIISLSRNVTKIKQIHYF